MAKPELVNHRKFTRLKRLLGAPVPHVLGYLECLWSRGYQTGNPNVGDELDVEAAIEYPGERGAFTKAAVEAGFLDDNGNGTFSIHNLYDHAPEYVKKRMVRMGTAPKGVMPSVRGGKRRKTEERRRKTEDIAKNQEPRTKNQEPKDENEQTPATVEPSPAPHSTAVRAFTDRWQARYGERFPFNGGKDGQAVKWMLDQVDADPDRLAGVLDRYFADPDPFVGKARHSLGLLRSQFARWLVPAGRSPPPPVEPTKMPSAEEVVSIMTNWRPPPHAAAS